MCSKFEPVSIAQNNGFVQLKSIKSESDEGKPDEIDRHSKINMFKSRSLQWLYCITGVWSIWACISPSKWYGNRLIQIMTKMRAQKRNFDQFCLSIQPKIVVVVGNYVIRNEHGCNFYKWNFICKENYLTEKRDVKSYDSVNPYK